MTSTISESAAAAAPLALGDAGRLYLLAWLHADVLSGVPITEQSWRDAWGKAADYQTVVNARAVLAVEA